MPKNSCTASKILGSTSGDRARDLMVYHYGMEKCEPNHYWTGVRDHYLIHYIMSGLGKFIYRDKTYDLKAGQGFLICPNTLSYYKAHEKEPWQYCWVGFQGRLAGHYISGIGIDEDHPIISHLPGDCLSSIVNEMVETKAMDRGRDMALTGLLYRFLGELTENGQPADAGKGEINYSEIYVSTALDFIEKNYSRNISIEDIADYVGICRKYLSSLFKDVLNTSPQNYLINYRMDRACVLLTKGPLSIAHVAHSVGYDDALLFSKMFKKYKGMAPTMYRKRSMGLL